jgi:ABC-type transporter Mla subunit MlaD
MPNLRWLDPIAGAERAMGLATGSLELGQRLVTEVPKLMASASGLLTDIQRLVARVDRVVTHVESTVRSADVVIEKVDATRASADTVVTEVDGVAGRATALVALIEPPVRQVMPLLHEVARLDPSLVPQVAQLAKLSELVDATVRLRPLLEAAGELDPTFVRSLDGLTPLLKSLDDLATEAAEHFAQSVEDVLERLPKLVKQVSEDVIPTMQVMVTAVPDVQQLRAIIDRLEPILVETGQVLAGLPGAQRMRRRGEKELEDYEPS